MYGYRSGDAEMRSQEAELRCREAKIPPEVPTRKNYHQVYEDGQFNEVKVLCLVNGLKFNVGGIIPQYDKVDLTGQFYSGAWFVTAEGPMFVPWTSIMYLK